MCQLNFPVTLLFRTIIIYFMDSYKKLNFLEKWKGNHLTTGRLRFATQTPFFSANNKILEKDKWDGNVKKCRPARKIKNDKRNEEGPQDFGSICNYIYMYIYIFLYISPQLGYLWPELALSSRTVYLRFLASVSRSPKFCFQLAVEVSLSGCSIFPSSFIFHNFRTDTICGR